MSMIFRESGRKGHETMSFIRTYYCSEVKRGRQLTLGKIKISEIQGLAATDKLLAELSAKGATDTEKKEVLEMLCVMKDKAKKEQREQSKEFFLMRLEQCANDPDFVFELLSEDEQTALFGSIKKLEDRLREKGIRRPRKPRK